MLLLILSADVAQQLLVLAGNARKGKGLALIAVIADWVRRRPNTIGLLAIGTGPGCLALYGFRVAKATAHGSPSRDAITTGIVAFAVYVLITMLL